MISRIVRKIKSRLFTVIKLHRFTPIVNIGKHSSISGNVLIKGTLFLDNNVELRNRTQRTSIIGDKCTFNRNVVIRGLVNIGNNVAIGPNTVVIGANHNFSDVEIPINRQGSNTKGVVIEDNVWIGANVTVLDGVTIGTGSIIGAGSVVSKSIPSYSIGVGVPCKVIRKRK